jgi:predicted nucleic acid-binding protein
MVGALFDTNILIDYLRGVDAARTEIARFETRAISAITWMEVMVGASVANERATRDFLDGFDHVPLDDAVAEQALVLRRRYRLKLPDAVIWASARSRGLLLVTRDRRDFPVAEPGIWLPYLI